LSYNLDLRSPDYVSRDLFFKKRTLLKVLSVIFFFSPLFSFYGLNHYHQLLANQATILEKEVIMLRQEAEPLLIITSELESIEIKKQLIEELKPDQEKWSAGLHLLHHAAPAQITITRIEIATSGSIKINGISSNMHAPARYRQNLSALPVFGQTELNIMTLNSDQNYTFKITSQLSKGDESDDNPEKTAVQ